MNSKFIPRPFRRAPLKDLQRGIQKFTVWQLSNSQRPGNCDSCQKLGKIAQAHLSPRREEQRQLSPHRHRKSCNSPDDRRLSCEHFELKAGPSGR